MMGAVLMNAVEPDVMSREDEREPFNRVGNAPRGSDVRACVFNQRAGRYPRS